MKCGLELLMQALTQPSLVSIVTILLRICLHVLMGAPEEYEIVFIGYL